MRVVDPICWSLDVGPALDGQGMAGEGVGVSQNRDTMGYP